MSIKKVKFQVLFVLAPSVAAIKEPYCTVVVAVVAAAVLVDQIGQSEHMGTVGVCPNQLLQKRVHCMS